MNERQRKFLIGVGIVMIAMLLFPPFYYQIGEGARRGHCYSLIFSPPDYYYAVNIELLVVQLLAVATIGFIGWYVLGGKR